MVINKEQASRLVLCPVGQGHLIQVKPTGSISILQRVGSVELGRLIAENCYRSVETRIVMRTKEGLVAYKA